MRLFDIFKDKTQELNDLTVYDMVILKSTLEVIHNQSLNCSLCMKKGGELYREKTKGCTGKYPFAKRLFEGVTLTKCAGNYYSASFAQLIDVHRMHRKGVLAYEGGLLDQPSKYIDAMNFLETLVIEKENEQLKKSLKDGRKQSRR